MTPKTDKQKLDEALSAIELAMRFFGTYEHNCWQWGDGRRFDQRCIYKVRRLLLALQKEGKE